MSNFWLNEPSLLFENLNQLWPSNTMDFNEKLNAISKLVILLTIIGFLFTKTIKILLTGVITLIAIIILYFMKCKNNKILLKNNIKEGFVNECETNTTYAKIKKDNPLNNVKLTDIEDNPTKEPAPPAFDKENTELINKKTKEMVKEISFKNQPNIDDRLFKDLGDNFNFDMSMRQFYSTPNTKVVAGDQNAFAQWCYGNMPSCKEDYNNCEKHTIRHPPL